MFYPPGVPDEAKTDSSLIDEAVTFINERIANSVLKSSLETGNYNANLGPDGKIKADLYRKGTDIPERISAIMAAFNDLMEMLTNDMEEDEEH